MIEFKVFNSRKEKSLQDTVDHALAQIREKHYDAVLLERGFQGSESGLMVLHFGGNRY